MAPGLQSRGGVRAAVLMAAALLLSACAHVSDVAQPATTTEPAAPLLVTPAAAVPWTPLLWPGKQNVPFIATQHQGRPALRVSANRSMSILRQRLADAPVSAGQISFSWAVDGMFRQADIGVSGQDDAPVRVVLAFDGDRSRLSPRARMQSELSRALLGEDMPYATLTYIWCNTRPVGTVLVSPRTDRVRKIVVESGEHHVGQWRDYQRDIAQDYRLAFGEEPGPLIGVALMTDADNTGEKINAWYGALHLSRR
jgi:hypothetical protein